MICRACGRDVSQKDKTCGYCGRKLPYVFSIRKWHLITACFALAAVALIAALVVILRGNATMETKTVYLRTSVSGYGSTENMRLLYDNQGQLISLQTNSLFQSSLGAELGKKVSYEYEDGRLVRAVLEDGNKLILNYRYRGDILQSVETDPKSTTATQLAAICDEQGRIIKLQLSIRNVPTELYKYTYHQDGYLLMTESDSEYNRFVETYDSRGNVICYEVYTADVCTYVRTWEYDEAGRLTKQYTMAGETEQTLSIAYETDSNGYITQIRLTQTADKTVSVCLRGSMENAEIKLELQESTSANVPEDLHMVLQYDDHGNLTAAYVIQNNQTVYHYSYKYTELTVPADYQEPNLKDPVWFAWMRIY